MEKAGLVEPSLPGEEWLMECDESTRYHVFLRREEVGSILCFGNCTA